MDNMREKLAELLEENPFIIRPRCDVWQEAADWLLAHGVTVLPVQVGDTVYGRFHHQGKAVHECRVVRVKLCQHKDKTIDFLLDVEFDIIDPYYRDGRLMTCWHQVVFGSDYGNWDRVYRSREEAEATPPKGEG